MSRPRATRLAATAALSLTLTGAGALGATAAGAAPTLPAPVLETTTVTTPGYVSIYVSGSGCLPESPDSPHPGVYAVLTHDLYEEGNGQLAYEDGTWRFNLVVHPDVGPGVYPVQAVCDRYTDDIAYPVVYLTVTDRMIAADPGTSTPAPPPVAAPVRGPAANSAGVTSPDTGAATGDRAAPGATVVKTLHGFKPFEWVTVTLHSTPQVVGSFRADAAGVVRVEFAVPAGTPAAAHTLVYLGDQGTYFQEAFTVTAPVSAAGSDGLAYTGADVAVPLVGGVAALLTGGAITFVARRRRTAGAGA